MRPLEIRNNTLYLLDQTKLPTEVIWIPYDTVEGVAKAIRDMIVRGAPAIGVTAAYGVAIAAKEYAYLPQKEWHEKMAECIALLAATRPTAVNLFWALDKMKQVIALHHHFATDVIIDILMATAIEMDADDVRINRAIGENGLPLIPQKACILTHCNAGALATADYGTALGIIRAAWESGKEIMVHADETRPYLQGARLTMWELMQDGIPATLNCDNMAGYLMQQGKIDCVITGADRIAANGDTANKIGTYTLAVLAAYHHIPFYIAAPLSTIDQQIPDGTHIPIEQRAASEVTHYAGVRTAPIDAAVVNPAFDVTPASLITAIVTEKGILYPDYTNAIAKIMHETLLK